MKIFNIFLLTIVQEKITIDEKERHFQINEIKKMKSKK